MNKLFTNCNDAQDVAYKNICLEKSEKQRKIKYFCESLWRKFNIYADNHFLSQIKRNFYNRYWEMYLTVTILEWGYTIESNSEGPDVLIKNKMNKIWIEAVTSGNGDTKDSVPKVKMNITQVIPEEQMILRLRNSIEEKSKVYKKYIKDLIIEDKEPFVIALNGAKLNFMTDDDIPYILKALLPIGNYYSNFKNETLSIGFRDKIVKKNGAEISTNIFFDDKYKHISAILYSNVNAYDFDKDLGSDFILIHNPKAINPLPIDILKKGKIITIDMNKENNTFEVIGLK